MAGQQFLLDPWQQFFIWNVYGWKHTKTGYRRFSTAYLEVARKNGKTTLGSGVLGYMLSPLEGEPAAQCFSVATKEEQARIAFDSLKGIINVSPKLKPLYEVMAKSIFCPATNSFFKPLGSDSKTQDGFDPFAVLMDEYHEHKDDGMYNVMETGMVARRQPLIVVITTAGTNTAGPCYRMHETIKNILSGKLTDERTFGIIYTLDEEDKKDLAYENTDLWVKANPGLGSSITLERLKQNFEKAKNEGGTKLANFLTKNLNIWQNAFELWDASKVWHQLNDNKVLEEDLKGMKCYGGLDVGSNDDLTALTLSFPPQGKFSKTQKLYYFFIPEDRIIEKSSAHRVDYKRWIELGYIKTTPGNALDIEYIRVELERLHKLFDVENIHFDPYSIRAQAPVWAEKYNFNMIEMTQTIPYMAPATKEYERQIFAQEFNHGGNPVMNWMISNVEIYRDANGNIKIMKKNKPRKVDGPVSDVMATHGQMAYVAPKVMPGISFI